MWIDVQLSGGRGVFQPQGLEFTSPSGGKMNAFVKIVAAIGAVVFTAAAVTLPDVAGYCTARAMSSEAREVAASFSQPLQVGHATQVTWRLTIG
jgi:hypothetical protein